jgi:hypothetical protein
MLKSEGEGDPGDEPRPPWQWVGFGTVMIFVAWLPLAYVGTALVLPSPGAGAGAGLATNPEGAPFARVLVATVLPLALATLGGGFLVGRFGKPAGLREALLAGALTGFIAVLLTVLSGPFSPRFVLVVAITTAFAGIGGALGVRQRTRR